MKGKLSWTCLVGLAVTTFFLMTVGQAAAQKGDATAGKAKFKQFCTSCHGATGKGDGPASAAFNPKPHDFSDGKYMKTLKDADIAKITKEGGAAVGKSPLMPPWGASLSDQDIQNIVAYIRSLAK